ncbi:unnamed protein product [Spirodela intermedia]|uniref:Uncharacterized protein n=1 Tax=Spirodela intermedia TaxID=51605 RepID=A0A7I8JJJ4_SPIIN|nr:unnamed protein product [Spirodela intermedia]CAA6670299.1 unnamed protein product [Spirodela intermedia]
MHSKTFARRATSEPTFPKPRTASCLTRLHGGVCLRHVPGHGGHQRDPVFRSSDSVRRRGVDHKAAELSGSLKINVVDANSSSADDFQPPLRGLKHLPRHLGPAPHDQRVAEGDLGAELLLGQLYSQLTFANPRRTSSPASPSFSDTSTVGFDATAAAADETAASVPPTGVDTDTAAHEIRPTPAERAPADRPRKGAAADRNETENLRH